MTVTASSFRTMYPEFVSTDTYPDATINVWLPIAEQFVNGTEWGWNDNADLGVCLVLAHFLSLGQRNILASGKGGIPGSNVGAVASKSVGGAAISYNTALTAVEGAGEWNATTYGQRYATLRSFYGAGAFQF